MTVTDETIEATQDTLIEAVVLVRERGWSSRDGHGRSHDGPLCVMAALGRASVARSADVHGLAYVTLKGVLGIPHPDGSLCEWNDNRCRDQDEAVQALMLAAQEVPAYRGFEPLDESAG